MAHRIIPVVVDQTEGLDLEKRYWKLGLFNADGSPFTGTIGPQGPEGPQGPAGEDGEAGYIDSSKIESDFDIPAAEGDITGWSIEIPPITVPVILRVHALVQKRNIVLGSPTAGAVFLYITDSANTKFQTAGATLDPSGFGTLPLEIDIPASGSTRTFKIRGAITGTGGRIVAAVNSPATFIATKG